MAAKDCRPQVQACRIRVCRLDANGVPTPGANSMYTSRAFTTIGFGWEREDADQIREKNACGEVEVDYRGRPTLLRGNLAIALVKPDPRLAEILTTGTLLTVGDDVGYAAPSLGTVESQPVSIEVWAKRIENGRLDVDRPYARWVYPWVENIVPEDHEHGNGNMALSFSGEAYENDNWYDGPTDDWPAASDKVFQWLPVADLPDDECAYQVVATS